jgi:hypothetical protein
VGSVLGGLAITCNRPATATHPSRLVAPWLYDAIEGARPDSELEEDGGDRIPPLIGGPDCSALGRVTERAGVAYRRPQDGLPERSRWSSSLQLKDSRDSFDLKAPLLRWGLAISKAFAMKRS